MIREENQVFHLDTKNTSYIFGVLPTGQLEHMYYGRKLTLTGDGVGALREKHAFAPGNSICYDQEHLQYSLEDVMLEASAYGKGDIREPFVELVHEDGSSTCDFQYDSFEISRTKRDLNGLPGSYDASGEVWQLCVRLKDSRYHQELELYYWVYEEADVISRSARLIHEGSGELTVKRLMSLQLDLPQNTYNLHYFSGAWAREMRKNVVPIRSGKFVNASFTGTTSNRANSFIMLAKEHTTEEAGECMGFHLIYSGNHYEAAEVNAYGKTRLVTGINPRGFAFVLGPGEEFVAPEAVMCYSAEGFNGLSQRLHGFINEHIVRGEWKKKERPILLNSWEAAYFNINESRLLSLAKAAKEVGVELFVMDDGWFGERNDDSHSLGDWQENQKKLPGGLKGLCEKINQLGLEFGIWVEPEMVNENSNLYREHPEWVLEIPGHPHSEGRNQRVLNLSMPEVQDFLIREMSRVFSSANIAYVKWDMNRIFSDVFGQNLPANRQGEIAHRYVLGLYRCMKELTERFPHILFEGCASGGNRFDLGMLCYFPQIWASDNTDALCRSEIQNGLSYGYPLSSFSAHVSSCPNHQTLRTTPLETRFGVASFGVLGYECNFCDLKKEELEEIRQQIEIYKKWRRVLQYGVFYRGRSFSDGGNTSALLGEEGNLQEWICVDSDQSQAVGLLAQRLVIPNQTYGEFHPKGLADDKIYHFCNRELKYNVKHFGDLVNTVAPIHIKQDSLLHNVVAKFVKMDGETEEYVLPGSVLNYGGVKLKQTFGATGYNEETRYFPDFGSRIYFMEETK